MIVHYSCLYRPWGTVSDFTLRNARHGRSISKCYCQSRSHAMCSLLAEGRCYLSTFCPHSAMNPKPTSNWLWSSPHSLIGHMPLIFSGSKTFQGTQWKWLHFTCTDPSHLPIMHIGAMCFCNTHVSPAVWPLVPMQYQRTFEKKALQEGWGRDLQERSQG